MGQSYRGRQTGDGRQETWVAFVYPLPSPFFRLQNATVATPWAKFSLPGDEAAYARGDSREFRQTCREIFGPLVEWVRDWPAGRHPWLMAEVPGEGSLPSFFRGLEQRLTPSGSLWAVLPKKPFMEELGFPFTWIEVQKAGLSAGLVDNKIAAFSPRLTSIRFVIPIARRKARGGSSPSDHRPSGT